jgi:cysteine desulfurase / selenocysteine lyase
MTGLDPLAELRSWQRALREQFPIIVAHPELVHLDSAATAEAVKCVNSSCA